MPFSSENQSVVGGMKERKERNKEGRGKVAVRERVGRRED